MTYNVFGGTLNPTLPIYPTLQPAVRLIACLRAVIASLLELERHWHLVVRIFSKQGQYCTAS